MLPFNRKIAQRRTVTNPLEGHRDGDLLPLLASDTAPLAITLLRHLQGLRLLAFPDDDIRRTLKRRIPQWRALNDPEHDPYLPSAAGAPLCQRSCPLL